MFLHYEAYASAHLTAKMTWSITPWAQPAFMHGRGPPLHADVNKWTGDGFNDTEGSQLACKRVQPKVRSGGGSFQCHIFALNIFPDTAHLQPSTVVFFACVFWHKEL